MRRLPLILLSVLIAAGVIGAAAYYRYTHPLVVKVAATGPAAVEATRPATTVALKHKERGPATQLLDIVRAADPRYPTTQPLEMALDLRYAARIVLNDPVHLDNQGNLWITRPDAPQPFNFLKASQSETATHVVRDTVVFVLWSATDNGKWLPHLVVKPPSGKGYQLVDYDGRRDLDDPYGFDWSRALVLAAPAGEADRIVVPTASGACAFAFADDPAAILKGHQQLVDPKSKDASDRAVQLVMDVSGVIAYVTNAAGTRGERGVARYARPKQDAPYQWTKLTDWPDHLLHLVPLLDGSVLQIVSEEGDEKDKVSFSLNSLAHVEVDKKKIMALVDDLSSSEPEKRDAAYKTLTTYGPGISSLLENLIDLQPVEAQIRIRQLLKNKVQPTLGGMSLNDGRMRVVNRLPDGGIIFFAEGGVAVPRPDDDTPNYITPAWLCIRPGRAVELLPGPLVTDLRPEKQKIIAWGLNDYVVLDPVLGPQWYIGNHLEPMLRKQYRQFTQFAGIDMTGRWIFKEPVRSVAATRPHFTTQKVLKSENYPLPVPTAPTTQPIYVAPSTQSNADTYAFHTDGPSITEQSTLIIDPHLPDPTPRLPGWQLPASVGKVGWDKNDWPVIYMENKPQPVPWALEESTWRVIDPQKEKVFTERADIPKIRAPQRKVRAATQPHAATKESGEVVGPQPKPATTQAATGPSTREAELAGQELILVGADGTQYFDGKQSLNALRPDGTVVLWPLPASAVGEGKVTLLQSKEGLLFLFNAPGRIVRIRPTPDQDEPFQVDATFTRQVPSDADPLRIWMDPGNRICIANGNSVTILFPIGRIPPGIAEKMRPQDFPPDEP